MEAALLATMALAFIVALSTPGIRESFELRLAEPVADPVEGAAAP